MTAEEKLIAYVDGELSAEERESFGAALAQDERLQAELAREELLRSQLADLHRSALDEEVPDRLKRLITPAPALPALRRSIATRGSVPRAPRAGRARWTNGAAIAASLVLGLFVGQTFTGPNGDAGVTVPSVAQGPLAQALETQLASSQTPDEAIQIGATFVGLDGQPCRTYEAPGSAGLACRSGGEWQLKLIAPGAESRNSEYQQAGSSSELVMRSAQEMLLEGPMDADQEMQARDAGWPGGASN